MSQNFEGLEITELQQPSDFLNTIYTSLEKSITSNSTKDSEEVKINFENNPLIENDIYSGHNFNNSNFMTAKATFYAIQLPKLP